MSFVDKLGICISLVVALLALRDSRASLRAAVAVFVSEASSLSDWVDSADLRVIFGSGVYSVLHELVDNDVLEHKEVPGGSERGGRPRSLYRWKKKLAESVS